MVHGIMDYTSRNKIITFMIKLSFLFGLFLSLSYSSHAAVRISNLDDIDLGIWPGSGDLVGSDAICIFDDGRNRVYNITIRGPGIAGAFELIGFDGNLPFTVEFAGSNRRFRTMQTSVRRRFRRPDRANQNCSGNTNAEVRITIQQSDIFAATGGLYTGDLVILLQP